MRRVLSLLFLGFFVRTGDARAAGMGRLDFPTSCSAQAQPHFLAGVLSLHSFIFEDALDHFKDAAAADPRCAMAYWGQAMAGNESLWQYQDTGAGREALAKAAPLVDKLPEKERAWMGAVQILYGKEGDTADKATRETAYASAMRRMHEQWPDDDEVTAFYALSLMQASHQTDKSIRLRMEAGALALGLFQKNPQHPGAAHYVIHAFDDPDHAVIALPAARAYAKIAPEAYHARHMPAHIFVQLGMWEDAAASCESAYQVSLEIAKKKGKKGYADFHSLSWLVSIYLQEGRPAKAREALSAFADAARGDAHFVAMSYAQAALAFVDETGRWDELADLLKPAADAVALMAADKPAEGGHHHVDTSRPPPDLSVKMTTGFAEAWAAARQGDEKKLIKLLPELRALVAKAPAPAGEVPPLERHKVDELFLQGILAQAQKKYAVATSKLEEAVALDDKLNGPVYFASPDRVPYEEYLGEAYLAAGKAKEARAAYGRALIKVPGRWRSLLGAARAATKLGDAVDAAELYRRLSASWAHAQPEAGWPALDEVHAQRL